MEAVVCMVPVAVKWKLLYGACSMVTVTLYFVNRPIYIYSYIYIYIHKIDICIHKI